MHISLYRLLFLWQRSREAELLLASDVLGLLLLVAAARLHLSELANEASLLFQVNDLLEPAQYEPEAGILVAAHSAEQLHVSSFAHAGTHHKQSDANSAFGSPVVDSSRQRRICDHEDVFIRELLKPSEISAVGVGGADARWQLLAGAVD